MPIARNLQGTGIQSLAAGAIIGTLADNLIATGTTQAAAMLISTDRSIFISVPSGSGARLPVGDENDSYWVNNSDPFNDLRLYPPTGGTINGGTVNQPFVIMAGQSVRVFYQGYQTILLDALPSGGGSAVPTKLSQLSNDVGFITTGGAPVQSVNGRLGAVTLGASDVGLANVNNTSDLNKPVSTPQQSAFDLKADKTNGLIVNPTIKAYVEQLQALNSGSAFTVDTTSGTLIEATITASATITLPSAVAGVGYTLIAKYNGAFSLTFTGGTLLKWAGGVAPTATAVNGKIDKYIFTCGTGYTLAQDGGRNF